MTMKVGAAIVDGEIYVHREDLVCFLNDQIATSAQQETKDVLTNLIVQLAKLGTLNGPRITKAAESRQIKG